MARESKDMRAARYWLELIGEGFYKNDRIYWQSLESNIIKHLNGDSGYDFELGQYDPRDLLPLVTAAALVANEHNARNLCGRMGESAIPILIQITELAGPYEETFESILMRVGYQDKSAAARDAEIAMERIYFTCLGALADIISDNYLNAHRFDVSKYPKLEMLAQQYQQEVYGSLPNYSARQLGIEIERARERERWTL